MDNFCIAGHTLTIDNLVPEVGDVLTLVPSLRPFQFKTLLGSPPSGGVRGGAEASALLKLVIVPEIDAGEDMREIGDFDTGNGHTKVEKNDDSGDYLFTIRNIEEEPVCLMHTNKDYTLCECQLTGRKAFWSYGLNSAIMLSYAFAAASQNTLLIHASCVKQGDYAYAFIAKSGTGKSTQVSNWLRHLPNCELLNDDNPIVRIINGKAYIYGSPWSGKTPCYRNRKAKLGAITRIERAQQNSVEKQSPIEAFTSLLPSCSTMKWEKKLYNDVMDTMAKVIETTNFYTLHCLPDRESAELCNKAIIMKNEK